MMSWVSMAQLRTFDLNIFARRWEHLSSCNFWTTFLIDDVFFLLYFYPRALYSNAISSVGIREENKF